MVSCGTSIRTLETYTVIRNIVVLGSGMWSTKQRTEQLLLYKLAYGGKPWKLQVETGVSPGNNEGLQHKSRPMR